MGLRVVMMTAPLRLDKDLKTVSFMWPMRRAELTHEEAWLALRHSLVPKNIEAEFCLSADEHNLSVYTAALRDGTLSTTPATLTWQASSDMFDAIIEALSGIF